MTQAQIAKYWREFAGARAAKETLIGRKMTAAEADAFRYMLHREAGAVESSKELTNREFDRVLGVFYAWSSPADIMVQGRQLDQPLLRYRYVVDYVLDQIVGYCDKAGLERTADPYRRGAAREGWLLAMLRRLSGDHHRLDLMAFAADDWQSTLTSVKARYDQVMRKTAGRPERRTRNKCRETKVCRGRSQPAELVPVSDEGDPF